MTKYEKELIYGILSKDEEMLEWAGNTGYSEEQREALHPLFEFRKTLKNEVNLIHLGVVNTQMSIARHYGGTNISGREYKYIYTLDCLVEKKLLDKYRKFKKADLKEKGIKNPKPTDTEFIL
jgi:hypothetical protein